jgi:hypothetical protein
MYSNNFRPFEQKIYFHFSPNTAPNSNLDQFLTTASAKKMLEKLVSSL